MAEPTDSSVVSTQPTPPNEARELSKIHAYQRDDGQWQADLEYKDVDGKKLDPETRAFDDFSQLSTWVAGTDMEIQQQAREAGEAPESEAVANAPQDVDTQTRAQTAVDNQKRIENQNQSQQRQNQGSEDNSKGSDVKKS